MPPPRPVPLAPQPDSIKTSCGCTGAAKTAPKNGESGKAGRKYQISLRIDAELRRRLRTAAAQSGISNQRLLRDALNAYLDKLGATRMQHCACLNRRVLIQEAPG